MAARRSTAAAPFVGRTKEHRCCAEEPCHHAPHSRSALSSSGDFEGERLAHGHGALHVPRGVGGPYFMLVAFEASGQTHFVLLLALWPLLWLLELVAGPRHRHLALRAAAFVATVGVPRAEVEAMSRAVLPKFMADDVDPAAWAAFGSCEGRRIIVTVERFAMEYLGAHAVVGCELEYSV